MLSSVCADADVALCSLWLRHVLPLILSLSTCLGRDRVFSCFLSLILELLSMLSRESEPSLERTFPIGSAGNIWEVNSDYAYFRRKGSI